MKGGSNTALSTWTTLGVINKSSNTFDCQVEVPTGMTLKLWMLGQFSNLALVIPTVKIRAYNFSTAQTLKETTLGALIEKYIPPYSVDGPCTIRLEGYQEQGALRNVNGFMVVSIE